ncbi:MAG: NYN domain-containing protein [Candidatus Omnitrophica bacterium]|nr:NYN domain-containing protein [Candidatus Omnitrophota bacterium]
MKDKFKFDLKGRTLVIIDWANVFGWFEKLKWEIDPEKLYNYLKSYPEIFDIRFYFGIEKGNEKSENFHNYIKSIGFNLISKEVKWVPAEVKISSNIRFKDKIVSIIEHGQINQDDFGKFMEFFNYIKDLGLVRRKCDFDVEITLDTMRMLKDFEILILFSGDGDYAYLVRHLIEIERKKVILVFAKGCKGKEYGEFVRGLFQCNVNYLKEYIKKYPRQDNPYRGVII